MKDRVLSSTLPDQGCKLFVWGHWQQSAGQEAGFTLRPLSGDLGVEVMGVDLKGGINSELHAQLQEVMHTKDLLLFRGQVSLAHSVFVIRFPRTNLVSKNKQEKTREDDRVGLITQDLTPKDEDAFMRGFPHNEEAVASDKLSNFYFKDWRVPNHKLVAVSALSLSWAHLAPYWAELY